MSINKLQCYTLELEVLVKEVLLPIYNKHLTSKGIQSKNMNQLIIENRKLQIPALLQPKRNK